MGWGGGFTGHDLERSDPVPLFTGHVRLKQAKAETLENICLDTYLNQKDLIFF